MKRIFCFLCALLTLNCALQAQHAAPIVDTTKVYEVDLVEVNAHVAVTRKNTPVAYSNVKAEQITLNS